MQNIEGNLNLANSSSQESGYERLLQQREFLDRISKKYSNHTKLLTHPRNFNYMLKEIDQFNEYYKFMLDNMKEYDFNFEEHEKHFNKLIEEDIVSINKRLLG